LTSLIATPFQIYGIGSAEETIENLPMATIFYGHARDNCKADGVSLYSKFYHVVKPFPFSEPMQHLIKK
jgi:hypothetical protein